MLLLQSEEVCDKFIDRLPGVKWFNMHDSKSYKKSIKTSVLLNVISKYNFLLIAIIAQIYVLLLLSLSSEFHDVLGVSYVTLINVFAIITLVVLVTVQAMQCTYPMSNELPVIIFLLWVLLSTHAGVYCICCGAAQASASHSAAQHVVVHNESVKSGIAVHVEENRWQSKQLHHQPHEEAEESVFVTIHSLSQACHQENFAFLYSTLSVILLLVALFTDLRNYYIALFNRIMTMFLLFLLIVLIVVSPSTCSQFSDQDKFYVILRLTFYHILWFTNHYRKITEDTLMMSYTGGIHLIKEANLLKESKLTKLFQQQRQRQHETPLSVLYQLEFVDKSLDESLASKTPTTSTPIKRSKTEKKMTNLLYTSEDHDAAADESGLIDTEEMLEQEKRENIASIFHKLVKTNAVYYEGLLSWKNRDYNKRLRYIIDIAQTIWVLLVIKYWLFILLPLQMIWLLYHINRNINEILQLHKFVKILTIYVKQKSSFDAYLV